MYYVYVLISKKDGLFYVGQTNDLSRRLWRHQQGYVRSTRHRRPLELLFYEEYETRSEAMKREKFLEFMSYLNNFLKFIQNIFFGFLPPKKNLDSPTLKKNYKKFDFFIYFN